MKTVGVLALQGDFAAHQKSLREAGAEAITVRTREELERIDALVIPGGESTTMLKLIEYRDLWEPLREFGGRKPVFGTCAGAILLATDVLNPPQASFGLCDMTLERNAYGRQVDSRIVKIDAAGLGEMEAVFIRAPIIRRLGPDAKVLARYLDDPVLVDFGRHLVATFHPEMTADVRVHELFLERL